MKTYFIFLCVIIVGNWASATTQTSLNQDKPPRLYIKSYGVTGSGNGAEHDYYLLPYDDWGNIDFPSWTEDDHLTFSENVNYGDGMAGGGSWTSHYFGISSLGGDGDAEDDESEWSWPASSGTGLSGITMSDTFTSSAFPGLDYIKTNAPLPHIEQEHCDINVTSDSYYQGDVNGELWNDTGHTTEQRHAQTTMKLLVGGKAIPGSRNLFRITGSAGRLSPAGVWNAGGDGGDGSAYYDNPIQTISNFLSQSITLGSYGALNTNGVKYITLNSGDDVDVTPYVQGADYYTFNVGQSEVQTKADWQAVVQYDIDNDSGVKIENYQASNGFLTNRPNIQAVYAFYQKLFTEQPTEFYWCGLAKLAGAPVYAGLSDAEYCKDGFITSGFLTLGVGGVSIASVLASEAGQFQNDLIGMNIAIYSDLPWQFEAYRKCGLPALEYVYSTDGVALDLNAITAWRTIDQGIQQDNITNIQAGNKQLLQREQQQILAQGYSDLSSLFPGTTSLMSIMAQNPVVGGPSFSSLEPSGNIATFSDRWDWVSRPYTSPSDTGILLLWLQETSSTQLGDVEQELLYRAQDDFSLAYELFGLSIY